MIRLLEGQASDMVKDAATCVRYCEGRVAGDVERSILIYGQSMGGGVAAELAARHFPHLPCVNARSFSSLSLVSARVLGLAHSSMGCAAIRLALSLAFSPVPWRAPLETTANWRRLRPGNKLLIYHPDDRVIGHEAALHTSLERNGELEGTTVCRLGGAPADAHNQRPSDYSPQEWAVAVEWMRRALQL